VVNHDAKIETNSRIHPTLSALAWQTEDE